ncbi:uncharacterized protein LOC114533400 [Dendronephthya gigantea]|uniref:uncharacterized protein LOC114533400 n=1 Tax=Dendronephthya gigantea TaxID=151771 RepID=UPI00106D037C|nr:uncharacterized protein LOC114533400 [Dendronephthya gigantea]
MISNYTVHSEDECSFECIQNPGCLGYNYRPKSKQYEVNCQISNKTKDGGRERVGISTWIFYQSLEVTYYVNSYLSNSNCTLIARFSNTVFKSWLKNPFFWYDRITYGDVDNPMSISTMISTAFWQKSGHDIKLTRSDDSSHTALLRTTSNCLQSQTFGSKITSYRNFRNHSVWASDKCLGRCPVIYGGQYKTTAGFEQHSCSSDIQNSGYIGFWCDWGKEDGAVMMISGGGRNCSRADHGIAITEENAGKLGSLLITHEFGGDASNFQPKTYSLNLWVR